MVQGGGVVGFFLIVILKTATVQGVGAVVPSGCGNCEVVQGGNDVVCQGGGVMGSFLCDFPASLPDGPHIRVEELQGGGAVLWACVSVWMFFLAAMVRTPCTVLGALPDQCWLFLLAGKNPMHRAALTLVLLY